MLATFSAPNLYQVRTGNKTEWMTTEEWLQTKKENQPQIQGTHYGYNTTDPDRSIQTLQVLSLSSDARHADQRWQI
jgi:hypothetical protein